MLRRKYTYEDMVLITILEAELSGSDVRDTTDGLAMLDTAI